jgi:hypothetical protein
LFTVDNGKKTVLHQGADLTPVISEYEFDPDFDRTEVMGYNDCIEALEDLLKTASQGLA